jgi:hypothetical protein
MKKKMRRRWEGKGIYRLLLMFLMLLMLLLLLLFLLDTDIHYLYRVRRREVHIVSI